MTDNGNESIRLDRLSDRFFKYLFATEEHKDLLIAFLNEVLLDLDPDGSARRIEDVAYGDRESSPLYRDAKLPRFDVIATAEDGRIFHIEVQVAKDRHFLERSLYYQSGARLLKKVVALEGDLVDYDAIGKIITVNGKVVPLSEVASRDGMGRAMPSMTFPVRLKPGEAWLASENKRGYDSRYFGPVSLDLLQPAKLVFRM